MPTPKVQNSLCSSWSVNSHKLISRMSKLYIVPTPIGNLDDITLRAIKVLSEADYILAEDTRTTAFLLKHLGIEKKLYSHHKFNEHATSASVAEAIGEGRTVALVSDAGTPGISDPGFLLVRTCVEAGIEVLARLHLFQHWYRVDFRAIDFASRVSFRKRRDAASDCRNSAPRAARLFSTSRLSGW